MRSVLLVFLVVLAVPVRAQRPFSPDDERFFHAGLYAGVNLSQVDGDGFSGYRKPGVAAGAMVFTRLSPLFQASLGIGFTQKGSREVAIRDYNLQLQYVELPLMLHLFPPGKFQLHAGIAYARLLSVKEASLEVPGGFDENVYPFRQQEWSWMAGLSYRLTDHFYLLGQHQYTFGSIRSQPDIPPGFGEGPERNNQLSLRLLFIIPQDNAR